MRTLGFLLILGCALLASPVARAKKRADTPSADENLPEMATLASPEVDGLSWSLDGDRVKLEGNYIKVQHGTFSINNITQDFRGKIHNSVVINDREMGVVASDNELTFPADGQLKAVVKVNGKRTKIKYRRGKLKYAKTKAQVIERRR